MQSIEPTEFESVRDARAYRKSGKEPFAGDKNRLSSWRVFFRSMPGSFVSSRQKTQIEAIRLFRVYTSSENTGDQREVSKPESYLCVLLGEGQFEIYL